MPRGVYDRSKLSKKKAAPADASDVADAPKVKRKYTKRAKSVEAIQSPDVGGDPVQGAAGLPEMPAGFGMIPGIGNSRFGFEFLSHQLLNLSSIKAQVGGSSGEFDTLYKKIVSQMNKTFDEIYPTELPKAVEKIEKVKLTEKVEVKTNGKTEVAEEKIEKTALPAPVPFIPQTPSQA